MPARSVCLVTLSLSEAGPGRFGRQVFVTDIYHTIPYHTGASMHFGSTFLSRLRTHDARGHLTDIWLGLYWHYFLSSIIIL